MLDAPIGWLSGPNSGDGQIEVSRLARQAAELAAENRHLEAVQVWREIDRKLPNHEGVAAALGAALVGAARFQEAVTQLNAACLRYPGNAVLLRLQSQALIRVGDSAAALGGLYLALGLDPENLEVHADLGVALSHQNHNESALSHALYAHCRRPCVRHAWVLCDILLDLGRGEEAIAIIDGDLAANIDVAPMLLLRSLCLRSLGRDEESLATARVALQFAPDDDNTRAGVAMALLAHGHLTAEAWDLYDSRAGVIGIHRWPQPERRWRGQDIAGRTVLVHAEQGFGDTLHFVRYVPKVAALGARVILAVQPALTRLMQGTPGADEVIAGASDLPEFDLYVPLLSLPGLFGTTVDTIPPPLPLRVPATPPGVIPQDGKLQVGLVWGGNRAFIDNDKRSLKPKMLAPLADVEGVTFHSLQLGATDLPLPRMRDAMQGIRDFADTAARIAALDLVITVDTSIAHLAATMGKPVWMLSRLHGCWRWFLHREDTPWYPTMRVYRQTRLNDWGSVIDRVAADLRRSAVSRPALATTGA